jgi:hypothetical protein
MVAIMSVLYAERDYKFQPVIRGTNLAPEGI